MSRRWRLWSPPGTVSAGRTCLEVSAACGSMANCFSPPVTPASRPDQGCPVGLCRRERLSGGMDRKAEEEPIVVYMGDDDNAARRPSGGRAAGWMTYGTCPK